MNNKPQIYDELERLSILSPIPFYWTDIKGVVVGVNKHCSDLVNNLLNEELIGKSAYEIYVPECAAIVQEHINMVMKTGKPMSFEEELVDQITLVKRYYVSSRSPLFENGKVIGVVGCVTEITAQKEADALKLKNEKLEFDNKANQLLIEQQKLFKQMVDQVVHDIRSPIASMQMILPLCNKLPENLRVSLNKSASRMLDIANNLLNKFKQEKEDELNVEPSLVSTLISAELLEIITEKKYEYANLPINFNVNISSVGYFVFLKLDMRAFKRMISNLINNSVDALNGKNGEIIISVDLIDSRVQIIIQDNGIGMPEEVKNKILNNITITSGKREGHGIGFKQIKDTLTNSMGTLDIESNIGVGTKIILTFPKIVPPEWIAEKIEFNNNDFIIVLDDDDSIHGAWEARLKQAAPNLKRKHFKQGNETIAFINNLGASEKERIFLLTDYELLHQNLTGLDVVSRTNIKRSILVTSHYNNLDIRSLAASTNTKILPKPLASEISIDLVKDRIQSLANIKSKNVDLVIVDDDKEFTDIFMRVVAKGNKNADKYYTAHSFLNNVTNYPKDTKILLDNQFKTENITGIELAKQLHEEGFTNLFLFSGHDFSNDRSIPHFLTTILKTDYEAVQQLLNM